MESAQRVRHFSADNPRPFAIALLVPAIILAAGGTLIALLGIFMIWLAIVGALVAAIVIADLARRALRRMAPAPVGALRRQAVGIAGR
jgi:membrane protein implicated in regulation of membrane protease activity